MKIVFEYKDKETGETIIKEFATAGFVEAQLMALGIGEIDIDGNIADPHTCCNMEESSRFPKTTRNLYRALWISMNNPICGCNRGANIVIVKNGVIARFWVTNED